GGEGADDGRGAGVAVGGAVDGEEAQEGLVVQRGGDDGVGDDPLGPVPHGQLVLDVLPGAGQRAAVLQPQLEGVVVVPARDGPGQVEGVAVEGVGADQAGPALLDAAVGDRLRPGGVLDELPQLERPGLVVAEGGQVLQGPVPARVEAVEVAGRQERLGAVGDDGRLLGQVGVVGPEHV